MPVAEETVFALSTAPGRSGVAVFRISGPAAPECLSALCDGGDGGSGAGVPEPGQVAFRVLRDPASGEKIDTALVFRFRAPASFTGEDMAEIQCHGSRAVTARLDGLLASFEGVRPAYPGEFSQRAFRNGKMDLLEAEGLGDLIHAETEVQRKQAMGLALGGLSKTYLKWRQDLIALLAYQEALIDFSEDDLPDHTDRQRLARLAAIKTEIADDIAGSKLAQAIRDGIRVVLIGGPNAGKSSLLNALTGRDAAIVTDIKGTTRDLIEVNLDLKGFPLILTDTAGLRKSDDPIEVIGITKAVDAALKADLVIEVIDLSGRQDPVSRETLLSDRAVDLRVGTKLDLCPAGPDPRADVELSALTGQGMAALRARLGALVEEKYGRLAENPSHTRARHRAELDLVARSLEQAADAPLPELAAESVRTAIAALDRLVGKSDVEEVLDVIFSDFCIGK